MAVTCNGPRDTRHASWAGALTNLRYHNERCRAGTGEMVRQANKFVMLAFLSSPAGRPYAARQGLGPGPA